MFIHMQHSDTSNSWLSKLRYSLLALAMLPTALLTTGLAYAEGAPGNEANEAYAAIRQAADEHREALENADFAAVDKFWTPEADYVDQFGHAFKIRAALEAAKLRIEKEGKIGPPPLRTESLAIRLISPDVGIEDGIIERPSTGGRAASKGRFCAVWVKRDGKWLIDGIRESAYSVNNSANHFAGLEWLVGEWTAEGDDAKAEATYSWGPNKKFIQGQIKLTLGGKPPVSITQWIGWDPVREQLRSFEFDTDGGFHEGVWAQDEDAWVVTTTGVGADGKKDEGSRILTPIDDHTALWEAMSQDADARADEDLQLRATRKPQAK